MLLRTVIVVSAAAALVSILLTVRADEDTIRVPKDIQDAVNQMADDLAKDNDVDRDAAALAKTHKRDLKKIMWLFKPRDKDGLGGLGVGAKPGAYRPDGIEAFMLNQISRAPNMTLNLKTAAADLNRLADITLAIAAIADQFVVATPHDKKWPAGGFWNWSSLVAAAVEKKTGERSQKVWQAATDDMKEAALALKQAVKAENKTDVKIAFRTLAASCNRCHTAVRDDDPEQLVFLKETWHTDLFAARQSRPAEMKVPQPIRQAVSAMADSVGKGEKIDKAADTFYGDHKSDFKTTKWLLTWRGRDGQGGFGVGPKADVYAPDEIAGYIARQASPRAILWTEPRLREAANDLNRLADITIVMAEVTQRYQPKHIIIGGPEIATPAQWARETAAMKQGALDLKAAVKANSPDDVKKAFTKMSSSCVSCHALFLSN